MSFSVENPLICFGMLCKLPISQLADQQVSQAALQSQSLLQGHHVLIQAEPPLDVGVLDRYMADILHKLAEQPGIVLQQRVGGEQQIQTRHVCKRTKTKRPTLTLSVIVYGPFEYLDAVGDFLENCELHLHDPVGCDRNVRYRNPQSLWALQEDDVRMTQDIAWEVPQEFGSFRNPSDLLADLEYKDFLPEAAQPFGLRALLFP